MMVPLLGLTLALWLTRDAYVAGRPLGWATGLLWGWLTAELLTAVVLPYPGPPPPELMHPRARQIGPDLFLPADAGLPPPTDDRPVLAFVGDSFTQGQGALAGESLPDRVAQHFGDRAHIRNLGTAGSEFFDQQIRYALLDAELEPDVLVWCFVLNDVEFGHDDHDAISVRWSLQAAGPTPLTGTLRRNIIGLTSRSRMEEGYRAAFDPSRRNWGKFEEGLRRLVDATHARGARFVFVVWPLMYRLENYPFTDLHAQLLRTAQDAGAETLDLYPTFAGLDERTLWAHPFDHHPNARGYALAAEAVIDALERRPLPNSAPWDCEGPTVLTGEQAAWERAWCRQRDAETLATHSERLWDWHHEVFQQNRGHVMIGRIPPLLRAVASTRRGDDAAARAKDLAAWKAMVYGQ